MKNTCIILLSLCLSTTFYPMLEYTTNTLQKLHDTFYKRMNDHQPDMRLHDAVQHNNITELRSLLRNKRDMHINPNQPDRNGNTPSHTAVASKDNYYTGNILTLRYHGADLDAQNNEGDTPLHIALKTGNDAAVEDLLQSGANPTLKNGLGKTPLQIATQYNNDQATQLLLQHAPSLSMHEHLQLADKKLLIEGQRQARAKGNTLEQAKKERQQEINNRQLIARIQEEFALGKTPEEISHILSSPGRNPEYIQTLAENIKPETRNVHKELQRKVQTLLNIGMSPEKIIQNSKGQEKQVKQILDQIQKTTSKAKSKFMHTPSQQNLLKSTVPWDSKNTNG